MIEKDMEMNDNSKDSNILDAIQTSTENTLTGFFSDL